MQETFLVCSDVGLKYPYASKSKTVHLPSTIYAIRPRATQGAGAQTRLAVRELYPRQRQTSLLLPRLPQSDPAPAGANYVAAGLLDLIESSFPGQLPASVGGLAIGADPITASIVVHAGQRGLPLLGFMVRKEAKTHGTGKLVEGPVEPGMSCVIVEDVITSGGSALKAAESAKDFGLNVQGIFGVIDRLEGGREAIEQAGYRLATLLTIDDFREST